MKPENVKTDKCHLKTPLEMARPDQLQSAVKTQWGQ